MVKHTSAGNGLSETGNDPGRCKSGRVVRIGTALGSYLVVIVNDLGPVADGLTREIEGGVLDRLRAHRHIAPEMATVDLQRGELDYESIDL
jgi:hypothetical protein